MSNFLGATPPGSASDAASLARSCSLIVAFIAVAAIVLAACTSSDSSTASSTSESVAAPASGGAASPSAAAGSAAYPAGKEQVCAARDQLKSSLSALTSAGTLTGGATGIKAAVTRVEGDVKLLAVAGKQDYQPQLTALQSALNKVQTALSSAGNNTAAALKAAASGTKDIGVAAAALLTQLKAGCGS